MRVTGKVTVFVDGQKYRSVGNGSGTTGGESRTTVKGGADVHGFTGEIMEPTLSFRLAHTKETSVKRVADWSDVTVVLETDTGRRFIYREAFTTEPPEVDFSSGEIPVSMAAVACEED